MYLPDDMIEACGKIFAAEYDVPYFNPAPVILDIGANVGCFTRWAKYRWPESIIYAYEPLPDCIEYLVKNTEDTKGVFITQCAIGARSETRKMYHGGENRGMSSFNQSEYTRSTSIDVSVKPAFQLPNADIVKCDTEGAEIEILSGLSFKPDVILVEYHSQANMDTLLKMYKAEYTLYEYKLMTLSAGNLKFIKSDILS